LISAKILKTTGEVIDLSIPTQGSEIKLSQALDFNVGCLKLFEFIKDHAEDIESKRVQYLVEVIKCLNNYFDGIIDIFDCDSSLIDISPEEFNEHIGHLADRIDIDSAITTALGLFNILLKTIRETKPQIEDWPQKIEYKDCTFIFPEIWKDKLYNTLNYKSISVKQAVEVLQIHNNYISNVSGLNQTDDAHVNSTFTKYLSELSVLLVKEGEKIPTDETEFKKFMADRMEFWKDIDLQTAVNIEAWFENYYKWLETDPENFYYFNNKDPQTKEEAEAMNKARAYNREIYQKIGAKSIVSRLIEIGTFNGLGRTNMESANEAPFTDAVKAISIENSKL